MYLMASYFLVVFESKHDVLQREDLAKIGSVKYALKRN